MQVAQFRPAIGRNGGVRHGHGDGARATFYFRLALRTRRKTICTGGWTKSTTGSLPQNNWVFFRILVNMGFETLRTCRLAGGESMKIWRWLTSTTRAAAGTTIISASGTTISPWAFHLLRAPPCAAHAAKRTCGGHDVFGDGARLFAPDFACWFDQTGRGDPLRAQPDLPVSRKARFSRRTGLCRRRNRETVGYGEMKHLLLGKSAQAGSGKAHLYTGRRAKQSAIIIPISSWRKGITRRDRRIGAMKAFLCLAMPEEHAFWQCGGKGAALSLIASSAAACQAADCAVGRRCGT